jgi:hypothetical protein
MLQAFGHHHSNLVLFRGIEYEWTRAQGRHRNADGRLLGLAWEYGCEQYRDRAARGRF